MAALYGLMMDTPLLVISLLEFAARHHGATEVVSRAVEGPIHRYGYRDAYGRAGRLAWALAELGIAPGDRVATLAWNTYRHFELYYAIPGVGAVCHTVNPRLHPEQIAYIVNHAEDRLIFADLTFLPLLERLAPSLRTVEAYVVMTDAAHMPAARLPNPLCYEALIEGRSERYAWPRLDERTASALCYTSGTTGDPRGVLYSHRSTVLHALAIGHRDGVGYGNGDAVMPVVPMFHANAWGMPFACPIGGAKLVLPGPRHDPESLYELLAGERVTVSSGVPTVWAGLLDYLRRTGKRLPALRALGIGGSAAPRAMVEAFENELGIPTVHGWGMTELSPIGTNNMPTDRVKALPEAERYRYKMKQGRGRFGVELRIVDEAGRDLPQDGNATGELVARGPWVASGYYKDAAASRAAWGSGGWFHTGDIASIDPEGYVQIVDRKKDLIKSGGEWISSIDLENAAAGHLAVAEAAVIARPDPIWGERPILVLRQVAGTELAAAEILDFLRGKVAKWALPDEIVFLDELPHTATGKVAKRELRDRLIAGKRPAARADAPAPRPRSNRRRPHGRSA